MFGFIISKVKKISWNPIFIGSFALIFLVLLCAFSAPNLFFGVLSWIQNAFVISISWFYVSLVFFFFCFCVYMAFGPYRKVRLGLTSRPKYTRFTWVAMLFSAGMGTGLLFSGVYEPLYHYFYPPVGTGDTPESLQLSFQLTFLHWGFSGWAIYTVMGLAFAYFSFCKSFPQRISSICYSTSNQNPVKGETSGRWGTAIDILSVTVILFGVATTLGRGAMQINSGLKELFGISYSQLSQSVIISVITLIATLSLLSGLDKGIRRLSELNILVCIFLLLFILFTGPTVFLLDSFVEYSGAYLQNLLGSMTWVHSLGSTEWRSQWTILYWAWWIAWAPFVGLFIAHISRGRTIQEFVLGSLLIPSLVSCIWFIAFGGTAIQYHLIGKMDLVSLLKTEYSMVVFEFLKHFPFTKLISVVTLFAVVIFFVTSSDSASYIVHHISDRTGKSPVFGKIYWALLEGVLAMVLIYFGGIESLQLLVIVVAFPFSLLLCFICYSFLKELRKDFT